MKNILMAAVPVVVAFTFFSCASTQNEAAQNNTLRGSLLFEQELHDFGEVTEGDIVKHTFRFKNEGPGNIKIVKTRTSCGCTTADTALRKYAPGEKGEMEVILDTAGKHGFVLKTIEVYLENAQSEMMELNLTVKLVPPPHPKVENVLTITKDPKCKSCHLDSGVGFIGGFLYHRVCAQCHGNRGKGASARAFIDREWQEGTDDDYIQNTIVYGLPKEGMPPYVEGVSPALTDDQLTSLVEYIRTLGK